MEVRYSGDADDAFGPEYVITASDSKLGYRKELILSRNTTLTAKSTRTVYIAGSAIAEEGGSVKLTLEAAEELSMALQMILKAYEDNEDPEL